MSELVSGGVAMKILAVYPICNAGAILIHDINEYDETVLASINGEHPDFYNIVDDGFYFGEWFIPFAECMRYDYGSRKDNI